MKYLRYLHFRFWGLPRRLRRLGFTESISIIDRREFLDYVKIVIGIIGVLSVWMIFWLNSLERTPIAVPPPEMPSSTLTNHNF